MEKEFEKKNIFLDRSYSPDHKGSFFLTAM